MILNTVVIKTIQMHALTYQNIGGRQKKQKKAEHHLDWCGLLNCFIKQPFKLYLPFIDVSMVLLEDYC